MEEARSLSFGITISTIITQAEEDIQHLMGMLGELRAGAAGEIDINADTEQASDNIRDLVDDIGRLQSDTDGTDIIVDADTDPAEENVRDLTGAIGNLGEHSADIDIDVDTEQAQTDVQSLEDRVTNFGHDPPDIEIDVDTERAHSDLQDLTDDIGNLGDHAGDIDINVDTDEARRNIQDLTDDIGDLEGDADSIGSAFRKSFLAGVDSGNSFSSSLRSGVGGALTYVGESVTDLKENVVDKMTGIKDSIVSGASSITDGFAHPIETIKNGLGGAIDHAKSRFTDFIRGADEAADAADDVGNAAGDAQPEVEDLGNAAETSGSKFEKFGGILSGFGKAAIAAVTAATVAVGGFAAASVSTGMEFDSSMSQVAATMGYSVEELNTVGSEANETFSQLREFAMEMGSSTAFSATEAADALNYMALAGYDAETSMTMLPNVLNLAAAGGIDLASASDMVTDAQSALGLTLDETTELVDKMAMASSKSNTSVAQLGEAILTVGGTAQNLAGGTTELSTALGILADSGIKGAEGGTHLRNVILSLSAPTDTAAKALSDLGVEVFDAEGNMRPLNETLGDLNEAMSDMTQAEQTDIISTIFNKTDIASVNALLANTGERWDELTGYIEDAEGAAQNMADTQLDNLAGDITLFQSALEGAQIVISDELTPSLRQFTQFGTESVTKLSEAFQEGGLTGAMGALGGILSDGLSMVVEMLPTAIDAGMQLLGALGQGLLDNTPLIIDAAIQIVTLLSDGILSSLPVLAGAAMEIIASLASGIGGMLPDLIPSVVNTVMLIAGTLIENLPLVINAGMQLISGLADGIIGAVPVLIGQLPVLIDQILGFLTESLPTILEQGATILTSLADGLIGAIPLLVEMLPEIITSICGFVTENLPTILEQGIQILTSLATGIIGALPDLIAQIPAIITGIVGTLTENFPSIVSTGVTMLLEFGAGIISAIPQLVAQLPAIGVAILGALGEIPGMVIDVGKSIVEGLWSGISSMASWVGDKVKGFASDVVGGIKDFLGIHSPSTVFAEIGDNMALGLGNGFTDSMKDVTEDIKGAIPTNLDGPEIDVPEPNGPSDMTYGVYPNVEGIADISNAVEDAVYKVSPIIEDINTPSVSDVYYSVNPLLDDFDPRGYEKYDDADDSDSDYPEHGGGNGDGGTPDPDGVGVTGSGEESGLFTFAPTVPIQITIEGNADSEAIEELKAQLEAEFEAKMRALFDEFQEEVLQRMALKNQYAF